MSSTSGNYLDKMDPEERALHSYNLVALLVSGIMQEGKCERNEEVEQLLHQLDKALQMILHLYRVAH